MASSPGVVLDGPVGAIVFWTLVGAAVRVGQTAAEQRRLAANEPDVPELEAAPSPRTVGALARSRN